MKKIILASSSPRRKELLEKHNIYFIIEFEETDEVLDESLTLSKQLENIAYQKALPIANKYPHDIVIGADTMVYFQGKMLGKPKDRGEAKRMLQQLSNNQQLVYSSVCIIDDGKVVSFTDVTMVQFKKLDEEEIEEYLDTNEWMGKAGAYAIQRIASKFIAKIKGDKDTVIGLPVRLINNYLNKGTID